MGVNDNIYGLIESIKKTPEFTKLKQTKTVISNNPKLKKEIDAFSQSQKQLQSGKLSVAEAESRLKQLNSTFESLSKIPEVDNYLKALHEFNQLISKVYNAINEGLDKNLQ